MLDTIEIRRLKVTTHIGVPAEERAEPQQLLITLILTPRENFDALADDISRTIDYYAVSLEIESLAASKPRQLIETLATDIANHLLEQHPLAKVLVRIEKHILPNTECVAVEIQRSRA
jgi:FolB domain-containing protein